LYLYNDMKSDIENRDWINEYPSLKQVSPANPFMVPAGYFDDLEDRIVSYKNLQEKYNNATEGFTVPAGYFEELPGNIRGRITVEDAVNTGNLGFTVPEGYFDELESRITGRIWVEETVDKKEPFSVSAGYFEQLNGDILAKTVNVDKIGRSGIVRKLYATRAFKYATAACFAVIIGGGILLLQLTSPEYVHTHSFLHKALSNVPVDEIQSYLQLNVDPGDTQQTVIAEGATVKEDNLKKALQDYVDSVQ
jgi:hypothetical protein